MKGEKHLLILENAEHEMASGIRVLLSTMGTFLRSLAVGNSDFKRPKFEQHFDNATGKITVTIPKQSAKLKSVRLAHGETFSDKMRDFRWLTIEPEGGCHWPLIPIPQPHHDN